MQNQLHLVVSAAVTSGGEGLAALRFAESVARAGCVVTLLSKDASAKDGWIPIGNGKFERMATPNGKNRLAGLFAQYGFMMRLCEQEQIDLVHLHGMWSPFLAVGALVARRRGLPLAISPHGCLEPWALGNRRLKKWLALKTYQGAILRWSSLFVATAEQEEHSIRLLGLRQPVAIIPNGVDVDAVTRHIAHGNSKIILFLSRLHPKKGLLDLVEAWSRVRRLGWRIVIAGGDEQGYRAKVENFIREKKIESDFEFVGFVDGTRKQKCFDMADVFVLPTYSENFGIAVAEALGNEVPVITTTGTPWRDLIDHHCGWWVEPGVHGLSTALIEMMECDADELRQMGQRGRQLVTDKYAWPKIGAAALEVSEWLLDPSRPKPGTVKESVQ